MVGKFAVVAPRASLSGPRTLLSLSEPTSTAQANLPAEARNLLRRLLCFVEPVRELEAALQGATPLALPPGDGKMEALSRLRGYAEELKDVAGKLLRPRGGLVSRVKSLWNAKHWKHELEELAKNIDRCVADLTLSEVREKGDRAMKAEEGAAEFHSLLLAKQDSLARQVAMLQRAGAAGSDSAGFAEVVKELADELRMQRDDVAKQLREERFLLDHDMEQLADLEARVLEAIDAKALSEADVARLCTVIGQQLAALNPHSGADADAVAAAVASSLDSAGLSAAGVQAAVRSQLEVRFLLRRGAL